MHTYLIAHYVHHLQDESAGSLSTGSGLDLDEGEEGLGADLQDDDNAQLGSDDDF